MGGGRTAWFGVALLVLACAGGGATTLPSGPVPEDQFLDRFLGRVL